MNKWRVTLRVDLDVDIGQIGNAEMRDILSAYEPTPESPTADDEWIAEEFAMRQVANAVDVTVLDSHPNRAAVELDAGQAVQLPPSLQRIADRGVQS